MRLNILGAIIALSLLTSTLSADARKGQIFYINNLKDVCKSNYIKNSSIFARIHNRDEWRKLAKNNNDLLGEWMWLCPSGKEQFKDMKLADIENLYDFVWKYALNQKKPTCR